MSRMTVVQLVLGAALLAAVVVGEGDGRRGAGARDLELRIEELEKADRGSAELQREIDSRLVHTEEAVRDLGARLDRVEPATAQWVDLAAGGAVAFDLGDHGRAQAQFQRFEGMDGVFALDSKLGRLEARLAPGRTLVLVDDLGTSRRVLSTTLHRIRLDRSGAPQAALLSMTLSLR